MSNLTQLRDRVEVILSDTANAIYTTGLIDECLRRVLHDYSLISPQESETFITCPADGREIALNSISNLLSVTDVWWPYDSTLTTEAWPPNRVRGFSLFCDNGQPLLILTDYEGNEPQIDDEVRVWYTLPQTIDGLDSAAGTTIPLNHETQLCNAAACYAALSRVHDLTEISGSDGYIASIIGTFATTLLERCEEFLVTLRTQSAREALPFPRKGWKLDDWYDHNA